MVSSIETNDSQWINKQVGLAEYQCVSTLVHRLANGEMEASEWENR